MKLKTTLFIIFSFFAFNLSGEESRFRLLQSIDSKVEKFKNKTASIDITTDSDYKNSAKSVEIHYILSNNVGFNYVKSEVDSKGLGVLLSFESNSYGASYLFGNENINLQIGINLTGETDIKELSDNDGDYTNQFKISSSNYRDYSLNFGLGITKNIELIVGFRAYQLEFDLKNESTNQFEINYNTKMIGIGIIF